jgi:hypothetical protein
LFGPKVKLDWPGIVNLRLGPFEKMGIGESLVAKDWWAFQFWRSVFVHVRVAKLAGTTVDFPPMQPGVGFHPEGVKKIEATMSNRMASSCGQHALLPTMTESGPEISGRPPSSSGRETGRFESVSSAASRGCLDRSTIPLENPTKCHELN